MAYNLLKVINKRNGATYYAALSSDRQASTPEGVKSYVTKYTNQADSTSRGLIASFSGEDPDNISVEFIAREIPTSQQTSELRRQYISPNGANYDHLNVNRKAHVGNRRGVSTTNRVAPQVQKTSEAEKIWKMYGPGGSFNRYYQIWSKVTGIELSVDDILAYRDDLYSLVQLKTDKEALKGRAKQLKQQYQDMAATKELDDSGNEGVSDDSLQDLIQAHPTEYELFIDSEGREPQSVEEFQSTIDSLKETIRLQELAGLR